MRISEEELTDALERNKDIHIASGINPARQSNLVLVHPVKRGNKYGAVRCYSELCGREFASRMECVRGEELALMEKAGVIKYLEYQPKYILCDSPKVTYRADFKYIENRQVVVEDVKGVLTRDTRTKLAWLRENFGIEVKLSS